MIKLTVCVYDQNYGLIASKHVNVDADALPPPAVISVFICEVAARIIDPVLNRDVHVAAAEGHISPEDAAAGADMIRTQQPYETRQMELTVPGRF